MSKSTVSTVLWMMFAWMLSVPIMAEEVKKSPSPLVEISVSPARIDWSPSVEAQRWVLTLSGPDELFLRRELKAGKPLFLSVFDSEGDRLPDGSYTWELKAVSKSPASPRRQSGSFSIQDGSFVETPRVNGGGAPKPPLVPTIAQDSIETGNLIVQQNACIGDECGTTDANFSALKLKSVNPNVLFDGIELPEGGGGSPHDWGLFVNYNDIDQFSIVDFSNALFPFSVAAGAPDNSLFIAGDGNVGLGTSTPAVRLDVKANITGEAVARVQNSSATGYSGIQYFDELGTVGLFLGIDNANNHTRFNSVNNLPITILTNGSERMRITPNGNIGIGIATPLRKLDIQANDDNVVAGRIGNYSTTGFSGFEYENESDTVDAFIGIDNANNQLRINAVNNNPIVMMTNSTEHVRIDSDGDLGINCNNPTSDLVIASGAGCSTPSSSINAGSTTFTASSSRMIKENLFPVEVSGILEKISGVGVYKYDFIEGPKERIGLMAEDFHQIFQRGSDKMLDGQEVEMALWLAVQELTAQNKQLSKRLAELEAHLVAKPAP